MSVLDQASLVLIPSGYKSGKLYSVVPSDGSGDLTFTRSTTATRVNESGLIETVGINVPRIDFTGGGCGKLLIEPQRTNLYLNSATLVTQNISTSATKYTVSFYGTGTITFTGTYTGSLVGTGAANRVKITFTATAGVLTSTVSGSCTSGQAEASTAVTSYIPTTGTTVTRAQDNSLSTSSGIQAAINSTEGVLFIDFNRLGFDVEFSILGLYKSSNSNNNYTLIAYRHDRIQGYMRVGGVYVCTMNAYGVWTMPRLKIAFKWKLNDFALWVNGVEIATDVSGVSFAAGELDTIRLGSNFSNPLPSFDARINNIAVFNTILTDTELTDLTTL